MAITTGKGLRFGDSSEIYIYGYPLPNYLSSIVDGKPSPWSVWNPTSTFNVGELPINSEVVVAYDDVIINAGSTVTVNWYRLRDGHRVFSWTNYASTVWMGTAAWIGYCTIQSTPNEPWIVDEIIENGQYRVEFIVTGATNYSSSAYFTVTGIPVQTNIISPANNFVVNPLITNNVTISAEAFGGSGISYVNFYNPQLGTQTVYSGTPTYSYPYSTTFDISLLPQGSHTFTVRAYDVNGNSSPSKTVTIIKQIPVPSVPTDVSLTAYGQTILYGQWSFVSNANGYEVQLYGWDGLKTYTTTDRSIIFSGLVAGEWYDMRVRAYNDGGNSVWSNFRSALTYPPNLTGLTVVGSTPNSISISWNESKSANFYEVRLNGNYYGGVSGQTSYTVTQLQPNTSYTIRVTPMNDSGSGGHQQITVTTPLGRPSNWEWFSYELNHFQNNSPNHVELTRWDQFIDRVNQFATYKGVSQLPSSVKPTSSDKQLYASHFRQIAQKIHDMSNAVGSELRNVQIDSDIKGWYFTHLASAITHIT